MEEYNQKFHEVADKAGDMIKHCTNNVAAGATKLIGSTCLVCADGGRAAHGLCSSQVAHEIVVCQHAFHRVGQRYCHSQRKPFWYGHHLGNAQVQALFDMSSVCL